MREYVVKLPAQVWEYEDAIDYALRNVWGDDRARLKELQDAIRIASIVMPNPCPHPNIPTTPPASPTNA